MSDFSFYRVVKKPPVAWVFLNRPDRRNAMSPAAWQEAPAVFEDLDADEEIRAVVLAGEGPCFCAGIDLKRTLSWIGPLLGPDQTGGVKRALLEKIRRLQEAVSSIERCRKPVIAAVHGWCIGAGLNLAAACDIRLCSLDAVFCLKEAAVGFVADVGALQRLPGIVGQGLTREMAYTAGEVHAARAREMHLVSAVHPTPEMLFQKAEELARQIADNPPLAVQAAKDVLNHDQSRFVESGLRYVCSVSANLIPSRDLEEALAAFAEKRKPVFSGK
ncbi:MAG: crotonase/enoyl-CoA hydratase family protein [Desulfobacteraceae bacterium]|nr:crotonase/enoyl-CoA hydratase family protein [Desulfobacteraceae bacterium]